MKGLRPAEHECAEASTISVQARPHAQPSTPRTEPARFYVPTDRGGTLEGSRVGVAWLRRRAPEWPGDPLVIVPTERHARSDPHIRSAIEGSHWETGSTYRGAHGRGWSGGSVLLLFPDASVLGWFDRHPGVFALCVVQGARYDTTAWARAHQPEDLTTGRPYPGDLVLDPVVEQALGSLVRSRDWQGLTSASDISLVVRSLRLLHESGHPIPPGELETWALSRGWRPVMAARLAEYAGRVLEGGMIPLRSLAAPPKGALARWRRSAGA